MKQDERHHTSDDIFVGIDLATRQHQVVVLDAQGCRLTSFKVPHSRAGLRELVERCTSRRVRREGRVHFAFEATGHVWEAVGAFLAQHALRYHVVNPLATFRVREARQMGRDKRNLTDAEQIAQLLRTGVVTQCQLLPANYMQLRRAWGELNWVSRRPHCLGGWSPWEDRGSTHRRCGTRPVGVRSRASADSQWAAIRSVATKIGCTAETLRHWVRQAERDTGRRPGLPAELLEREVRTMRFCGRPRRFSHGGARPGGNGDLARIVRRTGSSRASLPIAHDSRRGPSRDTLALRPVRCLAHLLRSSGVWDENFAVYGPRKVWHSWAGKASSSPAARRAIDAADGAARRRPRAHKTTIG